MRKIYSILFKIVDMVLPSYHSSKIGYYSNKIRRFFFRRIVKFSGNNINIGKRSTFSRQISIGNNSSIGDRCLINSPVSIGNNVMMAQEVLMFTTNHRTDRNDIPMVNQGNKEAAKITICDDVWIGARVIILPGVTIGKGSILGAGSVISKDVEPYSVMVGNPAKKVKSRI
jgi:maltose O-acetyltransferase